MDTHIEICKENQNGNYPVYHGSYNDMDFVNVNVIAGELLQSLLKRLREYNIIEENLVEAIDKGQKITIKLWKESRQ